MRMLKEHLNTISEHLLSARAIRPVAPMNVRPGHWCERACQAELRAKAPSGDPAGNAAATEELRRYHLQRLTAALSGMTAESAAEEAARDIHALLGTATWTDISAGDPYRFDPSGIDAAFARTACALATALNVLRKPLSAISAALPARIEAEINRRVLPQLSGATLPDMPLPTACLLLICVVLGSTVESRRWNAVRSLCLLIDQKLHRLPADGSMPGGIEYAAQTAVLLMDAMEVLAAATGGETDLTQHERIVCMADYPLFAHLQSGVFVNPGEHVMQCEIAAESLFRFGRRAGDGALCDLTAWLLRNDRARMSDHLISRLLDRDTLPALEETPGRIRLFRDGCLPDAGVMFMRGFNLHISMTGATDTSHADAGNICLYHKEQPVLVDIGPGAADTCLHSLPTIGGIGQRTHVPSRAVECGSGDETTTCYTASLTAAYPPQCHVSDYQRTLLMGSKVAPGIRLMDMIELTRPEEVDFHFICLQEPEPARGGMYIGPVLLRWNGDLTPSVERLPEHSAWRLTLRAPASDRQRYIFDIIPK